MATAKQEILKSAIRLEEDGRAFYRDAAAGASSGLARRMFESLVTDETDHIRWIEKLYPGAQSVKEANQRLYARLKKIFAEAPEEVRREARLTENDIKAIELAIGMELKSIEAYETWGRESDDEQVKKLCGTLAGIERFHRDVLQNSKEYLDRTEDWFTQDEHWSFDGG